MRILIQGEITDLNTYIKALNSHRYAGSTIKKEETERVAWTAKQFKEKLEFPVHITFQWYSKNNRKDIDNVAFAKKFILDGLVLGGVLPDDSRKYVAGFSDLFFIDKENPRVEIVFHRENVA